MLLAGVPGAAAFWRYLYVQRQLGRRARRRKLYLPFPWRAMAWLFLGELVVYHAVGALLILPASGWSARKPARNPSVVAACSWL